MTAPRKMSETESELPTREQIEAVRKYGVHAIDYEKRPAFVIGLCDLALSALSTAEAAPLPEEVAFAINEARSLWVITGRQGAALVHQTIERLARENARLRGGQTARVVESLSQLVELKKIKRTIAADLATDEMRRYYDARKESSWVDAEIALEDLRRSPATENAAPQAADARHGNRAVASTEPVGAAPRSETYPESIFESMAGIGRRKPR